MMLRRKLVSVLLVVAMVLGLGGTAMAAGGDGGGIMPLTEYMMCPKCGSTDCVVRYVNGIRVEQHAACGYCYAILNVAPHEQETNVTCASACCKMILDWYGISITEKDFRDAADGDYSEVGIMVQTLNTFLSSYGQTVRYSYTANIISMTEASYRALIFANLSKGYPLIANIKTAEPSSTTTHFPYLTSGHYIVIRGIKFNSTTNAFDLVVNDPFYDGQQQNGNSDYNGTMDVPLSEILYLVKKGNDHLIRVVTG